MKHTKKVLIILFVFITIIGILLFIKFKYEKTLPDEVEYDGVIIVNNTLRKVSVRNNYYTVKNIVEKYYYALSDLNKEEILYFEDEEESEDSKIDGNEITKTLTTEEENKRKRIYNFFNENYIQETNLSIDNLQDKLGNYNDLYVLIKEMYVRDITEYCKVYFVFGNIIEKQTLEKEDFKLMIETDTNNGTFNIYTSDYIDKNNLYELSKDKDFEMDITEIKNRKYNTYKYEHINDETYATDLLSNFTQSIKYLGTDYSYDKLDKEYKEKRFNEKSDYEKYVTENKKEITTALLDYYKVDKYNEYTQYVCMDRQGRYYIFRENANMDYSLLLDIYTIDLPEFIKKYEIATTEEKVKLNIEKIVEALNGRDYNYVYSKLAKEFKANYFKTYEDFEKYAEKTFDIGNKITYNQYTESENYSTYKITLKGKNGTLTKTIVMKLEEGTDFIMSFNVE